MPRRKTMHQLTQEQSHLWDLKSGSKVWLYLRHSPGDNQTIDSQLSEMRKWCATNSWTIDREFVDRGVEGSKEDRQYFQEMIALSRQIPRLADGVVIWSFSRFARNQLDAQFYKADLRKHGFVLLSKTDDVPNNDLAPVFEAFLDWKNQQFLKDMSIDVKRGQLYVLEQGCLANGVPPVGYRIDRVVLGYRKNGQVHYGNKLVKDESFQAKVELAWRMKIDTDASYREIRLATGLFKHSSHFSGFFNNIIYAGINEHQGKRYPLEWESGARFCDPYISLDEYYEVQAKREKRNIAVIAPRLLVSPYLLTGIMKCGICADAGRDSSICGSYHDNYRYYYCITKNSDPHECELSRMACWRLDEAVVSLLKSTVLTHEYVVAEVNRANSMLQEQADGQKSDNEDCSNKVKALKRKIEGLVDLISKKGMTPILEEQYDQANRDWQEAASRLARVKTHPIQKQQRILSLGEAERQLEEMLLNLDRGTSAQRRSLVQGFIERINVYPDHAEVIWKFKWNKEELQPTDTDEGEQLGGYETLYQGTVNASLVRVAEVLRPAIARNCPAIIVAHNHPSGDPTPSAEDGRVTEQIFQAAKLLDIALLDHVVIGNGRFISLREAGVGFLLNG